MPKLTSKEGLGALAKLGVSLTDSKGNMRDVIQVYTEVAQRMKNVSDSERIAVTEGLAG